MKTQCPGCRGDQGGSGQVTSRHQWGPKRSLATSPAWGCSPLPPDACVLFVWGVFIVKMLSHRISHSDCPVTL